MFEGEGHGWLKEDTILAVYNAQESWWRWHLCGVSALRIFAWDVSSDWLMTNSMHNCVELNQISIV